MLTGPAAYHSTIGTVPGQLATIKVLIDDVVTEQKWFDRRNKFHLPVSDDDLVLWVLLASVVCVHVNRFAPWDSTHRPNDLTLTAKSAALRTL